jgi:hypothetical protein
MKRYLCTRTVVLAVLLGAWVGTAPAWADEEFETREQAAAAQAAKRQEELHDKQMKGLGACIAAAILVSLLFWGLNVYNKVRKQKLELERKEAQAAEDRIPIPYTPPATPLPLEPPPSDW